MKKKTIALFASHNGSILESLNKYLQTTQDSIQLIITNNSNANVLNKAKSFNIDSCIVNNSLYENPDQKILELLQEYECNFIILAGYMKKISPSVIKNYTIINSHPALLPKFGGKGMYGRYVHEAVINNKEKTSGVTIHYVNENYDEGALILQKEINLDSNETVGSLEKKIKKLEQIALIEALQIV